MITIITPLLTHTQIAPVTTPHLLTIVVLILPVQSREAMTVTLVVTPHHTGTIAIVFRAVISQLVVNIPLIFLTLLSIVLPILIQTGATTPPLHVIPPATMTAP